MCGDVKQAARVGGHALRAAFQQRVGNMEVMIRLFGGERAVVRNVERINELGSFFFVTKPLTEEKLLDILSHSFRQLVA